MSIGCATDLETCTGSGLVGVKYWNSAPPEASICSGVWNCTCRLSGSISRYSSPGFSSSLYFGRPGCDAAERPLRSPAPAINGACLPRKPGIPDLAAAPNLSSIPGAFEAACWNASEATPPGILSARVASLSACAPAAACAAFSPACPTPRPPASEAPPNACRPIMRPWLRLPVAAVPAAAPPRPTAHVGRPNAAPAKPRMVGSNLPNHPASGSPVCGLMVSEPPEASARPCRLLTSSGVMWTSMESSPRP